MVEGDYKMSFEQTIKIPIDRIGAVIGKGGVTRKTLEAELGVVIDIDSRTGDIMIRSDSPDKGDPFTAVRVIEAIGRGFSPQRARRLLEQGVTLEMIDLRDFGGKSEKSIQRIRGRIIGLRGKSRRVIEELTNCYISVYGKTVSIIGEISEINLAVEAVKMLASGSQHKTVYNMLQRARRKKKLERMMLWESGSGFGATGGLERLQV